MDLKKLFCTVCNVQLIYLDSKCINCFEKQVGPGTIFDGDTREFVSSSKYFDRVRKREDIRLKEKVATPSRRVPLLLGDTQ